jgi:tRNA-2-methylthio-N6-dimethylallyladenosine synthase
MGRRYTKEEYIKLFKTIKEKVKNVSITTDIIVGFPNETEEDFLDTLDVVNTCKFDGAYTFIYSPREGTPASKINDNVKKEEKEERLKRLNKVVNEYSYMNNKKLEGTTVPVLVLGVSEKDENKLYGYTDTMKLVNVDADKSNIGKIIPVKILEAKSFSLDGKIVE